MSRSNRQKGFTLIEMLVVIAVLGVVLALLSSYAPPHVASARATAARLAASLAAARASAIAENHAVTAAGITFLPDGSASGGTLVAGPYTVTADWLTGQVSLHGK
jgi:prepilin-type N-terminal cleavage/methylation domain-containing protein